MKKIGLISLIAILLIACASEKMNFQQLEERNGVFFLPDEDKPFTGEIVSYFNGFTQFEGKLENGIRSGIWTYFFPKGQKMMQGSYKFGQKDGKWITWKENGQQEKLEIYHTGKVINSESYSTEQSTQNPVSNTKDTIVPEPLKSNIRKAPSTKPASSSYENEKKDYSTRVNAPVVKEEAVKEPVVWQKLHGGPVKFLEGVPYTGPVIKYQRNGEKEFEGQFDHGRKTGKWTYYDHRGRIKYIKFY